jgi:hypothetical protein
MEISQGYSLFCNIKQTCHFSFTKIENRRAEQVLAGGGGIGTSGRGEEVYILCTHVCEWKMIPVETIPGMEEGIKEND